MFVDFLYFFDEDARDSTSTTSRCFFRRRRTLVTNGSDVTSFNLVSYGSSVALALAWPWALLKVLGLGPGLEVPLAFALAL